MGPPVQRDWAGAAKVVTGPRGNCVALKQKGIPTFYTHRTAHPDLNSATSLSSAQTSSDVSHLAPQEHPPKDSHIICLHKNTNNQPQGPETKLPTYSSLHIGARSKASSNSRYQLRDHTRRRVRTRRRREAATCTERSPPMLPHTVRPRDTDSGDRRPVAGAAGPGREKRALQSHSRVVVQSQTPEVVRPRRNDPKTVPDSRKPPARGCPPSTRHRSCKGSACMVVAHTSRSSSPP